MTVTSSRGTYSVLTARSEDALGSVVGPADRVIVDSTVHRLHPGLARAVATEQLLIVEANEATKTFQHLEPLISWVLESGFSRGGRLVAIGGGTVQDAVAFVASIVHRGVPWVFYPTTLLAQCDSCIGSKTSINLGGYKNQLGTFHPPAEVVVDSGFLTTLSDTDIRSGLGEILHYLLIGGEDDFALAEEVLGRPDLAAGDDLGTLIRRSLAVKQGYVERDEFDRGERRVLNYGHSFAHAIEAATSNRIPHGIAVAHGMDIANALSCAQALMETGVRTRLRSTIVRLTVPGELRGVTAQRLFDALGRDKKREGADVGLILSAGPGRMMQVPTPLDHRLLSFLESYLSPGDATSAEPSQRGAHPASADGPSGQGRTP